MDSNRFIRPIPSAHWINFCANLRCFLRVYLEYSSSGPTASSPPTPPEHPYLIQGAQTALGEWTTHNGGQNRADKSTALVHKASTWMDSRNSIMAPNTVVKTSRKLFSPLKLPDRSAGLCAEATRLLDSPLPEI